MKTLYLIRHAKSDWEIENLPDIDRPLNARGYRDAHRMSQELKEKNIKPDLIITSSAIRTVSTALIFCRSLNHSLSLFSIDKNLYNSCVKDYLKAIRSINNKYNTAFLFGHNPIITNVAISLTNAFEGDMSTCSIVGISSEAKDWASLKEGKNKMVHFDYPKNHE